MSIQKTIVSLLTALKAVPEDKLADLADSIEKAEPGSMESSSFQSDIMNFQRGTTGPQQSMSGSGAGRMAGMMSDTTAQNALTEAYTRIGTLMAGLAEVEKGQRYQAQIDVAILDWMAQQGVDVPAYLKSRGVDWMALEGQEKLNEEEKTRKANLREVARMLKSAKKTLDAAVAAGDDADIEKALAAWQTLNDRVSKALKDDDDEEAEDEEPSDKDVEKGNLPVKSIKQMYKGLFSGRSDGGRDARRNLANIVAPVKAPPSMATLMKSVNPDRLAVAMDGLTGREQQLVEMYPQLVRAKQAGTIVNEATFQEAAAAYDGVVSQVRG